ncbi:149_t:CDS:2 [Cetraspora pellucida]|uniref:149_t:CDS:1 n=1 Tax=Cetraspora pellucida TaxID=1433469 RepID=A0A9N9GH46_9GLOM|nr:149_t:CDS:2 [Cetraspora pellucida]
MTKIKKLVPYDCDISKSEGSNIFEKIEESWQICVIDNYQIQQYPIIRNIMLIMLVVSSADGSIAVGKHTTVRLQISCALKHSLCRIDSNVYIYGLFTLNDDPIEL